MVFLWGGVGVFVAVWFFVEGVFLCFFFCWVLVWGGVGLGGGCVSFSFFLGRVLGFIVRRTLALFLCSYDFARFFLFFVSFVAQDSLRCSAFAVDSTFLVFPPKPLPESLPGRFALFLLG